MNEKMYRSEKTLRNAMKRTGRKFATTLPMSQYRPQLPQLAGKIIARTIDTDLLFVFHP